MKLNRPFWWMIAGSSICVSLATFGFRELLTNDGVSVAWLLFSFSMLGCGGFGLALTFLAVPIKERIVSVPARIVLFGVSVGLLWSLAPGGLADAFEIAGTPTVLIASGLTGVAVSFALYMPLMKAGRWGAFFLGIVALPVGAFCFGLFEPLIYFITHGERWAAGNESFVPLGLGVEYAVLSIISGFAELLIPLAMVTTVFLRAVILYKADGQLKGEAT